MRPAFLLGASVLSVLCIAAPASAQSLADRIGNVNDGAVSFHFASRAGVCGDGSKYVRIGRSYHGAYRSERNGTCEFGPVQVRLTMRNGQVSRVESWVGGLRDRDARDLGRVAAPEAARFLMGVAQGGSSVASNKAIFPAVLADSATVWPELLDIAKDSATRSHATRQDAMQWLSRFASAALAGNRNDPFADDDDPSDDGLKTHAVFVLSQLPRHEAVPALLDVARTSRETRVRRSALFWLGQSGDARAVALFEQVLRG